MEKCPNSKRDRVMTKNDRNNVTVKKMLNADLTQLPPSVLKQIDEEKKFKYISQCLKKGGYKLNWEKVRSEILEQMEGLLDTPLHSILTRSWEGYEKIQKIAFEQIDSGLSTISIVPLCSHKICSRQCPQITLSIEHYDKVILPITVDLKLMLSNVVVKLQYGKITNIIAGTCQGIGIVKYENIKLIKQKISAFYLLENIEASEVMRIAA